MTDHLGAVLRAHKAGERVGVTSVCSAHPLVLAASEAAGPAPAAVRYVIGTEVPVPGGAHETIDALTPTPPAAARATLDAHRAAFRAAGVEQAWDRVMALVVQPAVEFDHVHVV